MRLRLASDLDALIERARIERLLDHLHWPWDAGLSGLLDEAIANEEGDSTCRT